MFGKNIREKRWLAIIAILIFIAGGFLTAVAVQGIGDSHSGALVTSVGIQSDIGEVWGMNATGKNPTYQAAVITTGTGYVTATFAAGFNVTHIVVFEKNPIYDVQGILNKSLYFSTLNVGLSEKNATVSEPLGVNLTSVQQMFGTQVNDTSLHSINDKAMNAANMYAILTTYNSNVNQLNKSQAFSTFGLASANYGNLYGIVINVHGAGVKKGDALSVMITQSFGAPFNVNLISIFADVFVVEALVAVSFIALGMPRARGGR